MNPSPARRWPTSWQVTPLTWILPPMVERAWPRPATLPDIILLDLMMPGMDGYEVCTQLRSDPLLAEVPILPDDHRLQRPQITPTRWHGADDFIAKPFDGLELLTAPAHPSPTSTVFAV